MFILNGYIGANAPKRGTAKDMLNLAGQAGNRKAAGLIRQAAIDASLSEST